MNSFRADRRLIAEVCRARGAPSAEVEVNLTLAAGHVRTTGTAVAGKEADI